MPWYHVEICREWREYTTVHVQADSEDEAEEQARDIEEKLGGPRLDRDEVWPKAVLDHTVDCVAADEGGLHVLEARLIRPGDPVAGKPDARYVLLNDGRLEPRGAGLALEKEAP